MLLGTKLVSLIAATTIQKLSFDFSKEHIKTSKMSFAINLKREGQSLIEIGLYRPMNVFGEHQGILVNSGKI